MYIIPNKSESLLSAASVAALRNKFEILNNIPSILEAGLATKKMWSFHERLEITLMLSILIGSGVERRNLQRKSNEVKRIFFFSRERSFRRKKFD